MSMDLCISVFTPEEIRENRVDNDNCQIPLTDGDPFTLIQYRGHSYPGHLSYQRLGGEECLVLRNLEAFHHFIILVIDEVKDQISDYERPDHDMTDATAFLNDLGIMAERAIEWFDEGKIVVVGYC